MQNRKKMTVNIPPDLLRNLKLEAVTLGASYSDMLANRISNFLGNDSFDFQKKIVKYQHAGILTCIRKGRPSKDFIKKNGNIFNKKATFYFPESLYQLIRKSARTTRLPLSTIVTLALSEK